MSQRNAADSFAAVAARENEALLGGGAARIRAQASRPPRVGVEDVQVEAVLGDRLDRRGAMVSGIVVD